MRKKSMPTIWHIQDDLWEEFRQVLPPEKKAGTVGRPAVPYRKVLDGILYVLRTGCHWKKVPKEFGSGSTCHARFQEWVRMGAFRKVWKKLLIIYDRKKGIGFDWQSLDSATVKAPLGGTRLVAIQQIEASLEQSATT
jgi:transposase